MYKKAELMESLAAGTWRAPTTRRKYTSLAPYRLSSRSDPHGVEIQVEAKISFTSSTKYYIGLCICRNETCRLRKFYHVGVIVDLRVGNYKECDVVGKDLPLCVFTMGYHVAIVNCILK